MTNDPIVDEIRRIRHQIERKYAGNPQAYYKHVRELSTKLGLKVVSREPRRLQEIKAGPRR